MKKCNVNSVASGEFKFIERYFENLTPQSGVTLGIGDDGALISPEEGCETSVVVSMDTIVEAVHFPSRSSAYDIARRALCVNLSDLAAMGAIPRWFTLAMIMPPALASDQWLEGFSRGLGEIAHRYQCALIGGDMTRGDLALSVTAIGQVPLGHEISRSGAKPGDRIYVTGTLGDGAAALHILSGKIQTDQDQRLFEHFYAPTPRISEGVLLRKLASACIDVSDGLVSDLYHICTKSCVGADINLSRLPIHPNVKRKFPKYCNKWALSGGDDYQLCFTVPENRQTKIERLINEGIIDATMIGRIQSGRSICLIDEQGNRVVTEPDTEFQGYNHFV